jgi:hypothetical protein
MRRAIAIATVIGALLGTGVAQAAPASRPKPSVVEFVEAYQAAEGSWLVHQAGDTYMYFGGAFRDLGVPHNSTVGWAAKTKCAVAKTKHITVTVCEGSGRTNRIPDGAFQFDPALQTAHVKFAANGVHNSIDFTGEVPPEPDAFPGAGQWGAIAFADLYTWAAAGGRVLNHRFSKHDHSGFSSLDEGTVAAVFVRDSHGSRLRYGVTGNRVHFRAVFKTPIS